MAACKTPHTFEIRSRTPGKILTGANTQVLMDGKVLPGVVGFKFEVKAAKVAKVTLELIGDFSMHNEIGEIQTKIVPLVPKGKKDASSE